jgi:hypothetical protein
LVLLDVVREPIEWLTVLLISSRNNTPHLIFQAPNILFLQEQQLTFASCLKLNSGTHYHHVSLG